MKLHNDIHNFYEQMMLEKLEQMELVKNKDDEQIADLCCLVLNQLPPRYIRHNVDMAFYLPNSERQQMEMNVENAIRSALKFLDKNE
uniref:late competence development ComFB family protein n=1 Tax=Ningiella ruwaisensis TaxID=2364274 RepID=UPI0010A0B25F|nr:late competence development ComFB family protein [Ningiella ruwaisensis]